MNTLKLIEIVDEADDLAHSLALVPAETLIKFAELIVKKCAAYIDDNIGYDDCNNTYPVSGGELKDHFGVE